MCFPSVQEGSYVPPVVQCLKTFASYILSSFIVVCGGKASPELVFPSRAETELIIILLNCFQRLMLFLPSPLNIVIRET